MTRNDPYAVHLSDQAIAQAKSQLDVVHAIYHATEIKHGSTGDALIMDCMAFVIPGFDDRWDSLTDNEKYNIVINLNAVTFLLLTKFHAAIGE